MNLREAFDHQLKNTRPLEESDLTPCDPELLICWNGVRFSLEQNSYSSGKEMKPGDVFITGYITEVTEIPRPLLLASDELDQYEKIYKVVRVVDNVPVLSKKHVDADDFEIPIP